MKATIHINELDADVFAWLAENGFNISRVLKGADWTTVFVEVEEWSNVVVDGNGFTIYQGDKKYHFNKTVYSYISI